MPLDFEGPMSDRVSGLNTAYKHHSAFAVLSRALTDPEVGRIALVSSFGAESVVLLHMLSVMDRNTPVLFLETGMLFPETLRYQQELAEHLSLRDVRVIRPDTNATFAHDPEGDLHQRDPDGCCALRKSAPLDRALGAFDAWITGRKRFQSGDRAALEFFEAGDLRIKVNPLAHWTRGDVADYMENNRLPRHPLVVQGYPSIGCAPCTSRVAPGEDPRSGRWRGKEKTECGIHFTARGAERSTATGAVVAG